ncbi:MAG: cysteine desulfurase family protein, partial [bacterium]
PGNPSSVHAAGRRARAAVEAARRQVAQAVGVAPGELIFTSGATEALHLAILGAVPRGGHVVVSAVEHPAVFGACAVAEARVSVVPVDGAGRLLPADVAAAVRPDTALVAVMAAQNELGTLYPVAEIARAVGAPLLCDAAQALGRVPVDLPSLGAALAVFSAHKLGGPAGAGALWVRPGMALRPTLAGGPQERGRRAGTEAVAALVGFGAAAALVPRRLAGMAGVVALRDRLEAGLAAMPGVIFHGNQGVRLPNTSAWRFEGVMGDVLLAALDLEGFCLSSGSACSAGAVEPSPVLRALGLGPAEAGGGLRASSGPRTPPPRWTRCWPSCPGWWRGRGRWGRAEEVRACG